MMEVDIPQLFYMPSYTKEIIVFDSSYNDFFSCYVIVVSRHNDEHTWLQRYFRTLRNRSEALRSSVSRYDFYMAG